MKKSLSKAICRVIAVLVSFPMCYSCIDSQELSQLNNANTHEISINSDSRTIQEAIAEVDDFLSKIDNDITRSNIRRVGSVECVKSTITTRHAENDTLLYLINYMDRNGFALVGKSKYSRGIYAISPEGSLEMSDTIENKGLAMFVNAAIEDVTVTSIIPIDKPVYVYQEKRIVNPLLSENIANWHQRSPYNKYYVAIDGRETCVGCGPLAVGMLCAFYKFPYILSNRAINWNAIYNNSIDDIARFLTDLGSSDYLNASLQANGERSISASSITKFIPKVGFDISNAWIDSNFSIAYHDIFDFMKSGKNGINPAPILMTGIRKNSSGGVAGGHAWIVDGFIERIKIPKVSLTNPMAQWTEADPYLHCVWGWGEDQNGYYLYFIDKDKIDDKSKAGYHIARMYEDLYIWGALSH